MENKMFYFENEPSKQDETELQKYQRWYEEEKQAKCDMIRQNNQLTSYLETLKEVINNLKESNGSLYDNWKKFADENENLLNKIKDLKVQSDPTESAKENKILMNKFYRVLTELQHIYSYNTKSSNIETFNEMIEISKKCIEILKEE